MNSGISDRQFQPGLLRRLNPSPQKIAVLHAKRVGDFLCATPALRAIRKALPHAEITLVTMPFIEELAERSPYVDRFAAFPGYPGMAEQFFDARRATEFFRVMQARRFDLAIQMHGSGVYSNPFALMLGAPATAGFIRPGDDPGRLDAAYPYPEAVHEIRRLLALLAFLGIPDAGSHTEMPLRAEDRRKAARLLAGLKRPMIGLHPFAREEAKCWPIERFAEVGQGLQRRCGGTVVVLGATDERAAGESLAGQIGPSCASLAGRTSLAVLGAVVDHLALLLTNDSGPAHLAYSLRTPSITLFGPTDPAEWGPLEQERHRAFSFGLARDSTSTATTRNVLRAAEELLSYWSAQSVSIAPNSCWTGL